MENNLFTTPRECFSRQEAIKIFANKGLQGKILLGCANTTEEDLIVWTHIEDDQYIYLPAFKKDANNHLSQIKNFTPIGTDEIFISEGIIYYLSQEEELLRVDMLFDESLATSFLCLKLGIVFQEAELCYAFLDEEETYSDICWAVHAEDGLPRICSVFMDGSSPLLKCQDQFIHYIPMKVGQLFSHKGITWMLHSGEYGQEIRPFGTQSNAIS